MAAAHGALTSHRPVRPASLLAAVLVVLAAPAFFAFEVLWLGWVLLLLGLALATVLAWRSGVSAHANSAADHTGFETTGSARTPSLLRDLSLIALGLVVVRSIPLAAKLDTVSMVAFTVVLGGAVLLPYVVSRWIYRDRAIGFPWRGGTRWGVWHWTWLGAVLVLGVLLLPFYFMSNGVYLHWPVVDTPDLMARLFVGVGAVGIWDELFFICTVFALLRRHFPDWLANCLQAIVFVSFLWELGYRSWGPLLTVPFALVQGYIFLRTKSLLYVVTVHLLFDAVVFVVIASAHNPDFWLW